MANYTSWSEKAKIFMRARGHDYDLHLGSEHHLRGLALKEQKHKLEKQGWNVYARPAHPTSEVGTSGGTWILGSRTFSHKGVSQALFAEDPCPGYWSAATTRAAGRDVLWISVYLRTGEAELAFSQQIVEQLCGAIAAQGAQTSFIIAGDWNQTPEELLESGFVGKWWPLGFAIWSDRHL